MTNGTKLITGNHLETASVNAKRYIIAELLTLTNAITAELNLKADDEVFSAGARGIVPAPTANDADKFLRGDGTWALPTVSGGGGSSIILSDVVLDTVPSGFDGGMFYKQLTIGNPVVYLHHNNRNYSFVTEEANFDGDPSQYLFSHLTFNSSTTADACNNLSWTAYGSPTIGTANAIRGNALQLNGSSDVYSTTAKSFGGQDFTIDCYATVTSMEIDVPRIFSLQASNSVLLFFIGRNENNRIDLMANSTTLASFQIEIGRRYHYAICYFHASNRIKLFVDGELVDEAFLTVPTATIINLSVGNWNNHGQNRHLFGTIDEFRIHNGVALWATDFTPPTADDY